MFKCKIFEFGTNATIGKTVENIFFFDKIFLYDENLVPKYKFPADDCFSYGDRDGIWVNCGARGKRVAKLIEADGWKEVLSFNHANSDMVARIEDKFYVIDRANYDSIFIVVFVNGEEVKRKEIDSGMVGCIASSEKCIYFRTFEGSIYCLDCNLNEIWSYTNKKEINSDNMYLYWPIFYGELIIISIGEDKSYDIENFELNAYRYDTGDLIWQVDLKGTPSSIHLNGEQLYVSVGRRFVKIDASTGTIEMDLSFDYKSYDGQSASVSLVYPVINGLLCFNHQSHFIELRSPDGVHVLQTITLPETYSYHLSVRPPIIAHEEKIYFALGHLVSALNPMKSAIAVLEYDTCASINEAASLESRPPHQIHSIKDENGKNGFLVKIGGNNPDKIIRYAHIILKELAFKTGKTWLIEFETRDPNNAGNIKLEIDVRDFPVTKSISEWEDYFSGLKDRVEHDLISNDVKAGDGESNFTIHVKIN